MSKIKTEITKEIINCDNCTNKDLDKYEIHHFINDEKDYCDDCFKTIRKEITKECLHLKLKIDRPSFGAVKVYCDVDGCLFNEDINWYEFKENDQALNGIAKIAMKKFNERNKGGD